LLFKLNAAPLAFFVFSAMTVRNRDAMALISNDDPGVTKTCQSAKHYTKVRSQGVRDLQMSYRKMFIHWLFLYKQGDYRHGFLNAPRRVEKSLAWWRHVYAFSAYTPPREWKRNVHSSLASFSFAALFVILAHFGRFCVLKQ